MTRRGDLPLQLRRRHPERWLSRGHLRKAGTGNERGDIAQTGGPVPAIAPHVIERMVTMVECEHCNIGNRAGPQCAKVVAPECLGGCRRGACDDCFDVHPEGKEL
jgi:hypothetical protein